MSVVLRTEILPTDLTVMMRWLANPHVSHNLNEHEQIITRLHQMQTTQYVLTFDRYLHPDKGKESFYRLIFSYPLQTGSG